MIQVLKLMVIILFTFSLAQCQSKKQETKKSKTYVPSTISRHGEPKDNLVFYNPPKPTTLYAKFNKEDILFVEDLTADPTEFQNYETQEKQAVGLGFYLADLAYVSAFERTHLINDYYVPVYALSEALRISGVVDLEAFTENKDDVEKLVFMSDSVVNRVANYLFETEQEDVLILTSVGMFVESLYLAIKQVNKDDQYQKMIGIINGQSENFNSLYSFGIANSNSPEVEDVLLQVEPLHEFFTTVAQVELENAKTPKKFDRKEVDKNAKLVYDIRNKLLKAK